MSETKGFPINEENMRRFARSMEHLSTSARRATEANGPRVAKALRQFSKALKRPNGDD